MQRKDAILRAACDHFGRFGFRGASLRDIASDAGVSLTLLDHHFGNKSALLAATLQAHRDIIDAPAKALLRATSRGPGTFTLRDLVDAWVRTGVETAAQANGLAVLRLAARLTQDASDDGANEGQEGLDESGRVFIDALRQCQPHCSRDAAASAWVWMSAAAQAFLLGQHRVSRLTQSDTPGARTDDPARLADFLAAGLAAALSAREPDEASPPQPEHAAGTSTTRLADMAA